MHEELEHPVAVEHVSHQVIRGLLRERGMRRVIRGRGGGGGGGGGGGRGDEWV